MRIAANPSLAEELASNNTKPVMGTLRFEEEKTSQRFEEAKTSPAQDPRSQTLSGVNADKDHAAQLIGFCPLIALAEVDTSNLYSTCNGTGGKLMNTLDAQATSDKYFFSVAIINVFEMINANPHPQGLGCNLTADIVRVRNCFESLFSMIERRCRDGRISFIVDMDISGTADDGSVWDDNLETVIQKMDYIKFLIKTMQNKTDASHNLQHVEMISCRHLTTGKHTSFTQGIFEVPIVMYASYPGSLAADFFNHRVSLQGIASPSLDTGCGNLQVIPTIFASVLQPYVIPKSGDTPEEIIHPPDLTQVITRFYQSDIFNTARGDVRERDLNSASTATYTSTDSTMPRSVTNEPNSRKNHVEYSISCHGRN
jgi:hypothetical protein